MSMLRRLAQPADEQRVTRTIQPSDGHADLFARPPGRGRPGLRAFCLIRVSSSLQW
jgi:hypothetical protein